MSRNLPRSIPPGFVEWPPGSGQLRKFPASDNRVRALPLHPIQTMPFAAPKPPKRIRQRETPLLNRLETEYFEILKRDVAIGSVIRAQAVTVILGNGIRYTVDFMVLGCSVEPVTATTYVATAWEVKGPHAFDGALDKLKVAAATYPEIRWILAWKVKGKWQEQVVRPLKNTFTK